MLMRNHHQVAGSIGVAVENYEVVTRSVDYQSLTIVLRIGHCDAEDALPGFRVRRGDIVIPPWGPKIVHEVTAALWV
jgi:hypothetical protein